MGGTNVTMTQIGLSSMPDGSATAHFYRPKLVTVMAEGSVLADGTLAQVQSDEAVIESYLGQPLERLRT